MINKQIVLGEAKHTETVPNWEARNYYQFDHLSSGLSKMFFYCIRTVYKFQLFKWKYVG